uniref:Nuclear receptor domain-containing protein n=1 Tax=Parastrongyloides trichosuri TaxID=131310 RepID=A0A0N4Z512_PARTI
MSYEYWSFGNKDIEYEEVEEPNSSLIHIHSQVGNNGQPQTNNHPSLHNELTPQHQIIEQHSQSMKMLKMNRIPSRQRGVSNNSYRDIMMPSPSYNIKEKSGTTSSSPINSGNSPNNGEASCAVCGDGHAKLHYGVLACYGCKGFFRRTLTGKYRYVCRFGNNCVVDKFQRNSCRYCRFNRCLEVGMDPNAVRPDRDLTGRQKVPRIRKRTNEDELLKQVMSYQCDDWTSKLHVEARVMRMRLMNIESKLSKGENAIQPMNYIPEKMAGKGTSLRELFEAKPNSSKQRSDACFDNYRLARPDELASIANKSAVHCAHWIDELIELSKPLETEDKISLVKSCFSSLTMFNFAIRTVQSTDNNEVMCISNNLYVQRKMPYEYINNHLSEILIDRTINELVNPIRKMDLKEEEIVPLKAIIALNPNAKGLSEAGQLVISELRDKIQDMLFQIVKEIHPMITASSRFGNLLLLLPTVTSLSIIFHDNLQLCHIFNNRDGDGYILSELFDEYTRYDEPLITSSTVSPPMYENPADISLQSITPTFNINSAPQINNHINSNNRMMTISNGHNNNMSPNNLNSNSCMNNNNINSGSNMKTMNPNSMCTTTSSNMNNRTGQMTGSRVLIKQERLDGYMQTENDECSSPSVSNTSTSYISGSYNSAEDETLSPFACLLDEDLVNTSFDAQDGNFLSSSVCSDILAMMD